MSTAWFDRTDAVIFFRAYLPADDLSAFLPRPPAESLRPAVPHEDFSGRALSFRHMVHVLLTMLAYGDRRRAQKHRANGWAPRLGQPPALETLQRRDIRSTCAAVAEGTFSTLLAEDLDLLARLAARTRQAILQREEDAASWQAALEQQMRRTWGTLDNTLAVWEEEEMLQAEEEGWRACWRRLFGTRPPRALLPEPIKTYRPAWAQARPPALQVARPR